MPLPIGRQATSGSHRGVFELSAGLSCNFKILPGQGGVLFYFFPGVPLHEWEIKRPPGLPHDGKPHELLFDEKFEHGNFVIEYALQDKDIDP